MGSEFRYHHHHHLYRLHSLGISINKSGTFVAFYLVARFRVPKLFSSSRFRSSGEGRHRTAERTLGYEV